MKKSLQLSSITGAALSATLALSCMAETTPGKPSSAKSTAAQTAAVKSAAVKTAVSAAKRAVNAANAAQSAARAAVATHMTAEETENVRIYKDVNRAVVNISVKPLQKTFISIWCPRRASARA